MKENTNNGKDTMHQAIDKTADMANKGATAIKSNIDTARQYSMEKMQAMQECIQHYPWSAVLMAGFIGAILALGCKAMVNNK